MLPTTYKMAVALGAGLAVTMGLFVPSLWAQLVALFAVAPFMVVLVGCRTFLTRAVVSWLFFAAWMIPGCYWYFLIFPLPMAVGLALANTALLWGVVEVARWLQLRSPGAELAAVVLIWTLVFAGRAHLPFSSWWWMPKLTDTQWLNPAIVQAARLGDFAMVTFVVLVLNAILAWLWLGGRGRIAAAVIVTVLAASLSFNTVLLRTAETGTHVATVIGLQAPLLAGTYASGDATPADIDRLITRSREELATLRAQGDGGVPTFVIWPENDVPDADEARIRAFAAEAGIYLVYDIERDSLGPRPPDIAVLAGPDGGVLLENRKLHRAPGEEITESEVYATVAIGGLKVLTSICYEMHFHDIGRRLTGSDLALVPVNNTSFGSLLPYFHAADTVYRAVENGITIATASTNGPSFVARRDGLVLQPPLPIWAAQSYTQRIYR